MRITLARFNTKTFAMIAAVIGILAVACSGAIPTPVPTAVPAPTATAVPAATATPAPVEVPGSGIQGGDPEFIPVAMIWQGYWLSRDQFGPLVMGSGMGIPFEPPMNVVQAGMQMAAQNPNDQVMLPQNMLPLQAVFASGGSTLLNDPREFDPLDFEGLRLDPDTFDETVGVRGQAETMLKESQWAHNFANAHFGTPADDFGAQQRFVGVMVAMLSQMQGQYAMQNLLNMDDGLYRDSDGNLDYTGNWVMLHALSDTSLITAPGSHYMNPDSHPMFEGAATQLMQALADRRPESTREAASAIRALVYRSSTAEDPSVAGAALAKAREIADDQIAGATSTDVVEQAAAIVGLVAIADATGDSRYLDAADGLFQSLTEGFNSTIGIFDSKNVYNVDDVAWIIGGLNFLLQKGSQPSRGPASDMVLAFYEATISLGGMQLSAPPGKNGAMAGEFEKNLPSVVYYHPVDTPPPPAVGKLTVPAEEITWDGSSWSVSSDRLVTGGAMHLANELNWLGPHLGSIPFPAIQGN